MKGYRFHHWMSGREPDQIAEERIPVILDSVKQGNREAMTEMITGHMRLAFGLVARYNRADMADDLVSAAFYGITQAVDRIAHGHLKHDNASAYIATFVNGEIRRALAGRNVIASPEEGGQPTQCFDLHEQRHIGAYPDTTIDIEEEINSLTNDETDEAIVRMLRLGYDGAEIARELGLHRGQISRRIARIRETYKELENV